MGANLKLKEDLLDGLKRSWEHSGDLRSTSFWQVCLEKGLTEKNETECSEMLSTYARRTWDFQHAFKEFHEFLQEIPFAVALRHWVDVIIQDGVLGERYVRCMKRLLMQDALPLKQRDHAPVTLAYLRASGHQEIIENIRCQRVWTHTEKEEIVQCYVRFSYDLAKYTLNYVPEGYDPDRKLTHTRLISYEVFHSFIEHLSIRDALLSKLIYFGAPTIDEVLLLRVNAIDKEKRSICFQEKQESFPKHLIQDVLMYIQANPNPKGFVFANLRGEPVERAHLNQSFARACKKLPQNIKITPGSLLRFGALS